MRLYFDTAYIAKCYLNEARGEEVRKLARKAAGPGVGSGFPACGPGFPVADPFPRGRA